MFDIYVLLAWAFVLVQSIISASVVAKGLQLGRSILKIRTQILHAIVSLIFFLNESSEFLSILFSR